MKQIDSIVVRKFFEAVSDEDDVKRVTGVSKKIRRCYRKLKKHEMRAL